MSDRQRIALDALEEVLINAGHCPDAGPTSAVEQWQELQALGEPPIGAPALKGHEPRDLAVGSR